MANRLLANCRRGTRYRADLRIRVRVRDQAQAGQQAGQSDQSTLALATVLDGTVPGPVRHMVRIHALPTALPVQIAVSPIKPTTVQTAIDTHESSPNRPGLSLNKLAAAGPKAGVAAGTLQLTRDPGRLLGAALNEPKPAQAAGEPGATEASFPVTIPGTRTADPCKVGQRLSDTRGALTTAIDDSATARQTPFLLLNPSLKGQEGSSTDLAGLQGSIRGATADSLPATELDAPGLEESTLPNRFKNATEARLALSGDDDAAAAPEAKPQSPGILDAAKNFVSSVACSILPGAAGVACSVGLSATGAEDARNTANGIIGAGRAKAGGTGHMNAAWQLKRLEELRDPEAASGGEASEHREELAAARRGGLEDPVGATMERDLSRFASGLVTLGMSKVNPNPIAEGPGDAAPGPHDSGVTDPVVAQTPRHGKVTVPGGPRVGGPLPRGGL